MEKLQSLKLSGMTKTNGGKFDQIDISGMGKIFGDVEAKQIKISGSGTIEGSVKTDFLDVEGNGFVEKDVEAGKLETEGNFKIGGELRTGELESEGRCRVVGSVKADRIRTEGLLSVGAGVETEEFLSEGIFDIGGLLNANKIDARITSGCRVREIGGEEILIRRARHHNINFFLMLIGRSNKLQAELIEGTNITLEYTEAKTVRGCNIKIGPKCIIDQVEYSGTLEVDPDAQVGSQKKV